MKLKQRIATNLQSLRKAHGLSQAELADRLKVNKQTVWRLETGLADFRSDLLESIAKIFGIEPDLLLVPRMEASQPERLALSRLADVEKCLKMAQRTIAEYRRSMAPDKSS